MLQNRSTQKDVRMWFTENGYRGEALTFKYLELYAIKPPGWEQIFTFEVNFQDCDGIMNRIYGVAFDDERISKVSEKFKVAICFDQDSHKKKLDEWSGGFIVQKALK
ncbi:hypothetical protein N9A79_02060 [Pirellulales bacterium]|jgi:hypothetical protein|nr:hypothetical protein [Pirellulales bacterium]